MDPTCKFSLFFKKSDLKDICVFNILLEDDFYLVENYILLLKNDYLVVVYKLILEEHFFIL